MPIRLLPPDVASKIAAGEVVERPANVAKELLENSIDAGATEIRVEIREGGRRLLRVADNGAGIPAAEAPLAFERHATSKLAAAEDLDHIATFGFRGEALYSIAAVSQLTLTTRHRSEDFGVTLRLEGGELRSQTRAGAPLGTVVSVEHLFFNVPARQKFLKPAPTEAGQISAVVQRYALAHPDRRLSFVSDGRLLFQSAGTGDLFDVLAKVHGLEHARQMVPIGLQRTPGAPGVSGAMPDEDSLDHDVDFRREFSDTPAPIALSAGAPLPPVVTGYVSLPSLTRPNRSQIELFVNRRYVEDRQLTFAVVQAYHTLLPVGRFPLAVVFVALDPAQVDVNVHPQKVQVRFVDDRLIFAAVQRTVRRAVVEAAPVPGFTLGTDGQLESAAGATPAEQAGAVSTWAMRRDAIVDAGRQPLFDLYVPLARSEVSSLAASAPDVDEGATGAATHPGDVASRPVPEPAPLLAARSTQLPILRVVGQVSAMYIVAEGPEGLFLIDQHAAHERILYEKFMAQRHGGGAGAAAGDMGGGVARQQLLEPLTLHVGSQVAGQAVLHLEELDHVGFAVEPFGGDTFLVRAVPAVLAGEDPLRALQEILTTFADRRNLVGEELEARLVKMVCKRAAIKAGQLLSDLEMQELVRQLEACQSPRTCPHGRPTLIQLSAGELEKAFGRA
jgi:DNA mismatch repair protein MutL